MVNITELDGIDASKLDMIKGIYGDKDLNGQEQYKQIYFVFDYKDRKIPQVEEFMQQFGKEVISGIKIDRYVDSFNALITEERILAEKTCVLWAYDISQSLFKLSNELPHNKSSSLIKSREEALEERIGLLKSAVSVDSNIDNVHFQFPEFAHIEGYKRTGALKDSLYSALRETSKIELITKQSEYLQGKVEDATKLINVCAEEYLISQPASWFVRESDLMYNRSEFYQRNKHPIDWLACNEEELALTDENTESLQTRIYEQFGDFVTNTNIQGDLNEILKSHYLKTRTEFLKLENEDYL